MDISFLLLICLLLIKFASSTNNYVSLAAGSSAHGTYYGDGGQATLAGFSNPVGLWGNTNGEYYVADKDSQTVRKVATTGIISAFAGNSAGSGNTGDNGAATSARLSSPFGVVGSSTGIVFIADTSNNAIRQVSTTGIMTTVFGSVSTSGHAGDGGKATSATLSQPRSMWVDSNNNYLYVSDYGNNAIRRMDLSTSIVTVLVNSAYGGTSGGDGGAATSAVIRNPFGIYGDGSTLVYVAENGNFKIRAFTTTTNLITTAAGTGTITAYYGDTPATSASFVKPQGVWGDTNGNVFITDVKNNLLLSVCS